MEFRFDNTAITVNLPDRSAALAALRTRLVAGKGFALATINLDHFDKLKRLPEFRRAYAKQDFVTADGNPVVWLSRLAGRPVALVPGADLVIPLARLAAQADLPVALIGSTSEALALAASRLQTEVPGLQIALQSAPSFGFDPEGTEAEALLEQIRASQARLCLLALGAPRQEIFAAFGRARLPRVGFASIGAGLDFLAGKQRRAPVWVRRLALEWLWRAVSSPARLGPRYLRCAALLPSQVMAALAQRRNRAG